MNDDSTRPSTIADLDTFMKQSVDDAAASMLIPPHVWSALAAVMHEPDKLEKMFHALLESGAIRVFRKPDGGAE